MHTIICIASFLICVPPFRWEGSAIDPFGFEKRDAYLSKMEKAKARTFHKWSATHGGNRIAAAAAAAASRQHVYKKSPIFHSCAPVTADACFCTMLSVCGKIMCHAGGKCYVTKNLLYCFFREMAGSRQEFHESLERYAPGCPTTSAGSKMIWYTANAF